VGSPSTEGLPINFKSDSWVTVGNFSQYLSVEEDPEAIAQKLNSGQSLRGIGVFGRVGYALEETNPITCDAIIAFFAQGLVRNPCKSQREKVWVYRIAGPRVKVSGHLPPKLAQNPPIPATFPRLLQILR
jgi:hypothetical protein